MPQIASILAEEWISSISKAINLHRKLPSLDDVIEGEVHEGQFGAVVLISKRDQITKTTPEPAPPFRNFSAVPVQRFIVVVGGTGIRSGPFEKFVITEGSHGFFYAGV
ncbi:hypothetical protein AVEN_259310-1 [Araneus ventricosus]|uniref:Uncharacterized protein n=1 Tax=Araneus ventricosus TaxID=182803 RepID=A0A4Y2GKK8_ARAVE|nr:hypothetical protein AVEN_259310-1 [Araneus ventricosus]